MGYRLQQDRRDSHWRDLGRILGVLWRGPLLVLVICGIVLSFRTTRERRSLQRESDRLKAAGGFLEVADPDRVWVSTVTSLHNTDDRAVWKFRIFLPRGYDYVNMHRVGPIATDSNRCWSSSGGSSWRSPSKDPVEQTILFSLVRDARGRWNVHRIAPDGRSVFSARGLDDDDDIPERLVVAQAGGDGPESFSVDEPICLLRVHEPQPSERQVPGAELHDGFYFYLVPRSQLDQFEKQSSGESA